MLLILKFFSFMHLLCIVISLFSTNFVGLNSTTQFMMFVYIYDDTLVLNDRQLQHYQEQLQNRDNIRKVMRLNPFSGFLSVWLFYLSCLHR